MVIEQQPVKDMLVLMERIQRALSFQRRQARDELAQCFSTGCTLWEPGAP